MCKAPRAPQLGLDRAGMWATICLPSKPRLDHSSVFPDDGSCGDATILGKVQLCVAADQASCVCPAPGSMPVASGQPLLPSHRPLILFASLRAFLPVSPTLHLCFFICLFLSSFPQSQSQSLSTLSLSCSPSLILTSLFVSLSQSSTSFTLLWVPLYSSLSLSLVFFHFSVFASLPQPSFQSLT